MRTTSIEAPPGRYGDRAIIPIVPVVQTYPAALIHLLAVICAVAMSFAWLYEAPSKLHTFVAILSAYAAGAGCISIGYRAGLIRGRNQWAAAFLLKLILSFLITQYLWAAPFSPDLLRVAAPVAGAQDSNTYDYVAAELVQAGVLAHLQRLYFSWLSFGIVAYLVAIYKVFGISVLYVSMFNAVLSLIGFMALTGAVSLVTEDNRKWQVLRFGMLMPYLAYYDATPAKEPLTHALFFVGLLCVVRLSRRVGNIAVNMSVMWAAVGLLALVRVNVAILAFSVNSCLLLITRRALTRGAAAALGAGLLLMLAAIVAVPERQNTIGLMFSTDDKIQANTLRFEEKVTNGDESIKLAVGRALLPKNSWNFVSLSPLRAAIWTFSPYPFILPDVVQIITMSDLLARDRIGYAVLGSELPAFASSWMLIYLSPYIYEGIMLAGARRYRRRAGLVLVLNLIVPVMMISNFNFIMGRRYRVLVEPLFLTMALFGMFYGRPNRYRVLIYLGFGAVLVCCYCLKWLR
jgi:hypothetical protein